MTNRCNRSLTSARVATEFLPLSVAVASSSTRMASRQKMLMPSLLPTQAKLTRMVVPTNQIEILQPLAINKRNSSGRRAPDEPHFAFEDSERFVQIHQGANSMSIHQESIGIGGREPRDEAFQHNELFSRAYVKLWRKRGNQAEFLSYWQVTGPRSF